MSSSMPMSPGQPSPSFGERRGHRLAPLQTNFSRPTAATVKAQPSRLQRPRPSDYSTTNGQEGPVPLQSPVKRQSSKSSLRNLFTREKTTRIAVAPDSKLAEIEESQPPKNLPTAETPAIQEIPLSPSLNSPHTTGSTPTLTSPTTPRARATLKTTRSRPSEPKPPSQEQYGWKPPPLFQVYPQSTKHECLSIPAMSAESILRLYATSGKADLVQDEVADGARKKREQKERKHLRTLSGTINKVEWINKIYVLATAGFILQYAGEGKNDRLPEKMLQLGPQSVAFASDAIPGKHWVLQVSQSSATDSGSASTELPKARFSRFGFHRSNARRMASSFLLVFDNPDSMISWLMAVRAEIEARGGPKFTAEKHSDDDLGPQLRSKSSVRNIVKKDPHRISSLFLQPQGLRSPDEEEDGQSVGGLTWQSRRSSYVSMNRRSVIDSRSGSVSTGWTEATPPLNGSDIRTSSFTSLNPQSPPQGSGPLQDESPAKDVDSTSTRSPPPSSHDSIKRQSLYMSTPSDIPVPPLAEAFQPAQSPPTVPDSVIRCASPPAPNFSVPSFSKKFTSRPGPPPSTQASSPPSVAGVLRRGESTGTFSISSISSPQQSPTYSVASSRYTDSSEQVVLRDSNGRRILRPSMSEDALTRTIRPAQSPPNFSRVPRATLSETSPPPSRPLSLVGRPGLGIQMNSESQIQTVPGAEPVPVLRNRVSAFHMDQTLQHMARRKSMPGLTIGPPVAPPPNCPLPKIPSPIAVQDSPSLSVSENSPGDRFYKSQSIRDHVQDRRRSGLHSEIPAPSSGKLSKLAARQSRMIQ
ncbi:hypothetical protein N7462_011065 [Penicillium macrosclerotiorum]|uniref:uncharacterized protein n=1 Tax=Penicillium macrosclerotiorum TaxID=303699 RepID=UPI0025493736|nr:uncharacterized protein N7462_011065 [Penicillium macrosclerotiorum]KAJ5666656.1 hypothetical protein N7462_011065 [Penicillium macrosclerotiorum]